MNYEKAYKSLYQDWRKIAIRLGGSDDEDVIKHFDEYREQYNQMYDELSAIRSELGIDDFSTTSIIQAIRMLKRE